MVFVHVHRSLASLKGVLARRKEGAEEGRMSSTFSVHDFCNSFRIGLLPSVCVMAMKVASPRILTR